VKAVHAQLCSTPIDIFHLIYRDKPYEGDSKDYEFSRATVEDHWEVGMRDVRRALTQPEALVSNAEANGVTTYDLGEPDAVCIKRPMAPSPSTTPGSPP
jgi:NTE family protein